MFSLARMLCCQHQLIKNIISTLQCHERLQKQSAGFLMKLIESLGQHSISAEEIKILIKLLQNKPDHEYDNTTEFPYKSNVIHIISSIAKGDGYEHCQHYFDIQDSTEGITVPSIREWSGPAAGFTFHCWVRLDNVRHTGDQGQTRRQLYSFYTSSGLGLEAFFVEDGSLVVSTAYKKDFNSTKVSKYLYLNTLIG